MPILKGAQGIYRQHKYRDEHDFEQAVISQKEAIFGGGCLYLDCKRRIGRPGGKISIPDAYLFDFTSDRSPKLFVVEVELASHDLFDHIGVQLLEFAHVFADSPRQVKEMLLDEATKHPEIIQILEQKAKSYGLRNVDNMLDTLATSPFNALVVIDQASEELFRLRKNFAFPVEVLEVETYSTSGGDFFYRFEPLFEEIREMREISVAEGREPVDVADVDTIVVPAREEGFKDTFIAENRWYEIRINASMIPQIKYIAAYQIAPISAITRIAVVKDIRPWENSGKYVVNFAEPSRQIGPIPLVQKGIVKPIQAPRYTLFSRLSSAKTLDEVF